MNNIKMIRQKTKLSQSEFSKKFGIPTRTLQKWEQDEADPSIYLRKLIEDEISFEQYIDEQKYLFKPSNEFKRVIKTKFQNVERIHPIQQQEIQNIINKLKTYKEVKQIIVFGSSVTHKCNYDSDIDMYVELSKNRNVKKFKTNRPVDFWTNYTVESEMKKEIDQKGVVVYGC